MKYNLRFFLNNGKPMCEQFCFATMKTSHVPNDNDFVFFGDESIKENVEPGSIFKVVERVFVYNNYGEEDDLTSVEISVARDH